MTVEQGSPMDSGWGVLPSILCGLDGEPPVCVNTIVATTAEDAIAYAVDNGELSEPPDGETYPTQRVLMRELDPISCRIRGVDDGWWVECTKRAKRPVEFWRIDA